MTPDDPRHGTRHGYRDDRCKCDACKKAIALEHNVYKMRRNANGGRPLMVNKLGSVRRLRALMALGWPRRELARQAGYQGDAFAMILNGNRHTLHEPTARRIADLYENLCMTHGPSNPTRIRAQKAGWPPPLSWHDIDDPDENPTGWEYTHNRADAIRDLADTGASITDASRRLNLTREALEKWCARNGLGTELRLMLGRENGLRRWTEGVA